MRDVYIVTEGEYDYYCIIGVFSTKEKAEEYIRRYPWRDCRIEEYPIDEDN